MKKSLALSAALIGGSLLLFLLSLAGCGKSDYLIIFKDMHLAAVSHPDNGIATKLSLGDTAEHNRFYLECAFDITEIAARMPALPGNSAYAFQPGPRFYKPAERIASIHIIPLLDYNATYPAGADMTQACRFQGTGISYNRADSSEANLLASLNEGFSDEAPDLQSAVRIYLAQKPGSLSPQQFAIELRTEGDAVIRDTCVLFYLKP